MAEKIMPFEKDHPELGIKKLCDWFIEEQEEEEENVGNIIKMIEDAKSINKPMSMVDLEIALLRKKE